MACLKGSLRSRTEYLTVPKMMAEKAPAIRGAIAQEAATCDTEPDSHAHLTEAWLANPTPMRAPTTVWVVDTGIPRCVASMSQKALPTSVHI